MFAAYLKIWYKRNLSSSCLYDFCLLIPQGIFLVMYEGKSLNNRNFIITFLHEYLQKLFVSYFST